MRCSEGSSDPPVPAVPSPRKAIVVLAWLESFVFTVRVAVRIPSALAPKAIGNDLDDPGEIVAGPFAPVSLNSLPLVPEITRPSLGRVNDDVPVFLIVSDCDGDIPD